MSDAMKLRLIETARKIPGVRAGLWRMRTSYHGMRRRILVGRPIIDGGPLIAQAIEDARPFAAGKMGSIEAQAVRTYLRRDEARAAHRRPLPYPGYILHSLYMNAGVFPPEEAVFDRFGAAFLPAVEQCDMLVAWDVAGEADILQRHAPKATLIEMTGLEPYFSSSPWSSKLAGKRVLVISPFASSIASQYARRESLWDDPSVLPAFELEVLRCPLSAGLAPPESADWFEALARLREAMDRITYDVVLIGAGAFSLPLAAAAKSRGKVALHLGGSLQILFGIVGSRWRNKEPFASFIKPAWCSPSPDETPQHYRNVEGGCYW